MIVQGQTVELIQPHPSYGPFGTFNGEQGKIDDVDYGLSLFRVMWGNDTISIERFEDQDRVWKIV
jgi:hypothetical protein